MTPEQRRAHLVLHGQTLLDAWQARTKLCAEGLKLLAEGIKLWAEGDKLRAEASRRWAEGGKLCAKGNRLYTEGSKLCAEGDKSWTDAVAAEFGPDCTIAWHGDTCTLGCGETYTNLLGEKP